MSSSSSSRPSQKPKFWRPGTLLPGSSIDRIDEGSNDDAASPVFGSAPPAPGTAIQAQRARLPVFRQREQFLYMLQQHPVVIVQGQTGSGKSTQLPQYALEEGWAANGMVIACTQPRRVAATTIAARVAQEAGSVLGDEVGYTIRFEDLSSPSRTRLKFATDGILVREAMLDPLLSRYSVIMVDEAHERSAYTDLLLGLLKKIRRKRPELRLIISSATIDAEAFQAYFNAHTVDGNPEAAILSVEGRMFPVDIAYLAAPTSDYVETSVRTIFDLHVNQPPGDILVFLTGREEIDRAIQLIADMMPSLPRGSQALLPMPLHAGLSTEDQMFIFEASPSRTRKVVIATNIAEASITIDGIRYVVDSGFVKLRSFNPLTAMDVLRVTPISRASANQRAGRAGRTASGKCLRLYSEDAYANLPVATPPELCRSDLSQLILQLKALGIENIVRFEFMTPPPAQMLEKGLEFLYSLGALNESGQLSLDIGMKMAELPVDPAMAKTLLTSPDFACSEEILTIAAMTSVQNVFVTGDGEEGAVSDFERRKFTAEEGDHLTLLNVYNAFTTRGRKSSKWCHTHRLNFKALSRAVSIRQQLAKYLARFNLPIKSCNGDHTAIRRCLVSGYFKNAARFLPDGTYRLVRENTMLHIHPSSVMFTRTPSTGYVVFHDILETTKVFMRDVTMIESEWLSELSNGYYEIR